MPPQEKSASPPLCATIHLLRLPMYVCQGLPFPRLLSIFPTSIISSNCFFLIMCPMIPMIPTLYFLMCNHGPWCTAESKQYCFLGNGHLPIPVPYHSLCLYSMFHVPCSIPCIPLFHIKHCSILSGLPFCFWDCPSCRKLNELRVNTKLLALLLEIWYG